MKRIRNKICFKLKIW